MYFIGRFAYASREVFECFAKLCLFCVGKIPFAAIAAASVKLVVKP